LQMQTYALAVRERLGLPVKEAILYFLAPGEARSCRLDEAGLRQQLEAMGRALRTASAWEEFPANPAHCPRCPYQQFCRERV
ncbi:MAG TPA: PD-(D/E)XK nuclease family protein, partial [Symbiobacteriaceae bacterium]|nr:PD-(D/E)XK nuclease family protein [Symbiobacteriaceae bacterium]